MELRLRFAWTHHLEILAINDFYILSHFITQRRDTEWGYVSLLT